MRSSLVYLAISTRSKRSRQYYFLFLFLMFCEANVQKKTIRRCNSELAEMLGQVKPPTASKEEIENSGLQVIKSGELKHYEASGRVAANCTEHVSNLGGPWVMKDADETMQCLICLDEYQQEDDVRVMSCRHAFHKECVDKWLSTGKNNCPACRTKVRFDSFY